MIKDKIYFGPYQLKTKQMCVGAKENNIESFRKIKVRTNATFIQERTNGTFQIYLV